MSDAEKGFDISLELVDEFVFDVDFDLPGWATASDAGGRGGASSVVALTRS